MLGSFAATEREIKRKSKGLIWQWQKHPWADIKVTLGVQSSGKKAELLSSLHMIATLPRSRILPKIPWNTAEIKVGFLSWDNSVRLVVFTWHPMKQEIQRSHSGLMGRKMCMVCTLCLGGHEIAQWCNSKKIISTSGEAQFLNPNSLKSEKYSLEKPSIKQHRYENIMWPDKDQFIIFISLFQLFVQSILHLIGPQGIFWPFSPSSKCKQ